MCKWLDVFFPRHRCKDKCSFPNYKSITRKNCLRTQQKDANISRLGGFGIRPPLNIIRESAHSFLDEGDGERREERGKRSVSGSQILIFDYGGFQIRRNEERRNEEHQNGGPPKRHSLCLLKKEAAPGGIAGTASRLIVYLIKHDSQLTSPAPSWPLSCRRSSCRCGCRCRAAWARPPSCR